MYLSKIRVKNYKSFLDSEEIEFKSGINIIVGQNNAGKTALLEALSLQFDSKPHRSTKTLSRTKLWESREEENNKEKNASEVEISIIVKPNEIWELKGETLWLPYVLIQRKNIDGTIINTSPQAVDYEERLKQPLEIQFKHNGQSISSNIKDDFGNFGILHEGDMTPFGIKIIGDKKIEFTGRSNDVNLLMYRFIKTFCSRVYKFEAERTCSDIGILSFGNELNSNASNLPQVIQYIQSSEPDHYHTFNELVSEVIPSIQLVSFGKTKHPEGMIGDWGEVIIWTTDKKSRTKGLEYSISECGTGVGQVLAILYVIVTSQEPRTIIIDEPNSFLHPAASQKLIQILNKFPQHQYFISTHSPEIITASNPSTITMLNYVGGETNIEQIDLSNASGVKKVFKDLGIEPATFAFANHILWVEGQTEEKAFPIILEDAKIYNVVVKPTVASEFRQNRKRFNNVRHIFKLHETVSSTDSVISPKMTILLDKEIGKETENADLIKEFGEDKFNFIPRAMYENYLLDAEAITFILKFTKETENFKEKSLKLNEQSSELEIVDVEINASNVNNWIEEKKKSKEFLSNGYKNKEELNESEWLINVDGAKLLDSLFKYFLGRPFGYESHKIEYGEKMTQWFLENKPAQLSELKIFLINLISDKKSLT